MDDIDFDAIDDFIDVIPEQAKEEPLVVYVIASGRKKTRKLRLAFLEGPLAEIEGPRYLVRWSPKRRVLRVEAGDLHPYEPFSMGRGKRREILSCPVPAGFAIDGDRCFPEFYVDAVGRAINIEIPALPTPQPARLTASDLRELVALPAPKKEVVGEYDAVLAATLGITGGFPVRFGSVDLTPSEANVLEVLYRRERASTDAIMFATAPPGQEDNRDNKMADILIFKLRKKLEPLGVEIETIRGSGAWKISQGAKRFIAQLIGESVHG